MSNSESERLEAPGHADERQNALESRLSQSTTSQLTRLDTPTSADVRAAGATCGATSGAPSDSDFELVRDAWDGLPEAVRRQIINLVRAGGGK